MSKKDKPLKVKGDFIDVLKISIKGNPKPKKEY